MNRAGTRVLLLGLGVLMLLTVRTSAAPCSELCSPDMCDSDCAGYGGCLSADPTVRCGGRQAHCYNNCQDGITVIHACSDACYTSGGGGGSGSPIFARKPVEEPPPQ